MRRTLPDAALVRGRMVLRPLRPATRPRRKTRDQRFGRTQALVNTPIVAMAPDKTFALGRRAGFCGRNVLKRNARCGTLEKYRGGETIDLTGLSGVHIGDGKGNRVGQNKRDYY